MRGDATAFRTLVAKARRRECRAGRRHDGAALGGAERRRQDDERSARRRGEDRAADAHRAATRRCISPAREATPPAVARLLEAGSKPGAVTATGVQPLHLAAQAGNAEAVKRAARSRRRRQRPRHDARPHAARVRGVAEPRRSDEAAARARAPTSKLATTVVDYRERSATDTQARQPATARSPRRPARATNSGLNINDPPPTGQVGRPSAGQAVAAGGRRRRAIRRSGGAGAAPAAAAAARAAAVGHRADRHARAASPRCITPCATDYADAAMLLLDAGMDINLPHRRRSIDARCSSRRSTASTTLR